LNVTKTKDDTTGRVVASYGPRGKADVGTGAPVRYVVKGRKLRVVCGDRVTLRKQTSGAEWLATAILPRTNELERPDSRGRAELIAANLDCLALVLAPEPQADFYIADRYLCAAELMHAEAVVIWNKCELAGSMPPDLTNYQALGYDVITTSAVDGTGVAELAAHFSGGTGMLVGQSGVGKSSLINCLLPSAEVSTGALSTGSGEGKHTTTTSIMHTLPTGGRLIDSPGVREFAPVVHDLAMVATGFIEIARHASACRFSNCQHLREPNCAVKEAVDQHEITAHRYDSYKRLRNSATAGGVV
jgi:ribosome biogenesis GTPase